MSVYTYYWKELFSVMRHWLAKHFLRFHFTAIARMREVAKKRAILNFAARFVPMPSGVPAKKETCGGITFEWLNPDHADTSRAILYLHGGAFVMGSCETHRALAARIAKASQTPLLLLAYRLAPENPFPAALEDALCAYQILQNRGLAHDRIALVGDSAGGGLALSTFVALCERKEALPGALVLISPWLDLTLLADSVESRASCDPILTKAVLDEAACLYAGTTERTSPKLSPLFATFPTLPPTLVHAGSDDILFDDAARFAEQARSSNRPVRLTVWKKMWHVWHALAPFLPESNAAISEIAAFIKEHLS